MKVLFCQFGIPEVDALQPQANTALAAGYLIAYLKQYYPKFEFIQTPFWIADKMGMETFYQFIENDLPDIICFSLYLWNIDKTKTIINYLKKKFPLLKFIIGGPEVNDDNFAVLEKINFDAGVIGEGEEILRLLLATENWESVPNILLKNGNNKIIHTSFEDLPFPQLNRSRNPYLNDCLQHEKDNTIFVETVRGCPYRCKFCNYNKRYEQLQYNELAVLKELIQWAISNGKKEIFLLDPSFNVQTRFDEILELIIAENLNKQLCFATELRADLLTKE
ncbi:MAG: cobalamin-dependent protein, partial [Candidatus Cloacimonetes bacterium]|nr:cobalamin-dependent protein [Candidatus Cloacimonadota bacterium]